MAKYLYKYVGQYRVLAEYDHETKDYPRDYLGNIEPSFDDFYIPCRKKGKIIHVQGNNLMYYVPSNKIAHSMIRDIYVEKVGEVKEIDEDGKNISIEVLYDALVKESIITGYEILSGETCLYFKDKNMDYIASKVYPKTIGATITPLSVKNLPKGRYEIPEDDFKKYKDLTKDIEENLKIGNVNKLFNKVIQKRKGKGYDINSEMKKVMLRKKEFIHSIGLWDEYIEFLKKEFPPS